MSAKYFSKIENMDGVIEEFENSTQGPFVQTIRYMDYFDAHRFGNWIFDARVSFNINQQHKIAFIGSNIFNRSYSLRPLKVEAPRSFMIQYTMKLDTNDYKFNSIFATLWFQQWINKESVTKQKLKTDIEYNVKTSMKLLKILYRQHKNWKLAFGAYNTGRPMINKYAIDVYNFNPKW
jgi:hypothetical protein